MNTLSILLIAFIYLSGCIATYYVTKKDFDIDLEIENSLVDLLSTLFMMPTIIMLEFFRWIMISTSWIGFICYIILKYAERIKS